jgi:hypothetical protein
MKYIFLLLLALFLCTDVFGQALDALPGIDQPQPSDRIHTYTRGFSAAFQLDTLRKYFAADIVENIAVDPYTSIPDSLRGRFFTSTSDSLYYVDYYGGFVNLTGGGYDDAAIQAQVDALPTDADVASAQTAAEAYADANDEGSNWATSGSNISRATGTVAIGTSTPTTSELEIYDGTSNAEINLTSGLTGSSFASRLGFRRTGVAAGSSLQSYRNAAIGGVGISMMTTINNAAEISGALTETVRYWNTGEMTIGTSLTTPAAKLDVQGTGKFSGQVNMTSQKITNLATPTATTDAANKSYVDAQVIAGADGNGIEDGGDVQVPSSTDVQGYSYPSSSNFDTRQQWGHNVSGVYRNGWYTQGANGVGLRHEARFNSSGGLTEDPYYQSYGSSFEYTRLLPRGISHNSNGRYFMLDFYGTKIRVFYGTGANDWYQFGEDERPSEDGSVLVTDEDGTTKWEKGHPLQSATTANASVGTFPTGNWTTGGPPSTSVKPGIRYEFELIVYYNTSSGTDAEIRMNVGAGSLTGGYVAGQGGVLSSLSSGTALLLPEQTSNTRKTYTGYFTVTNATTVSFQARGVNGSANINAGTSLINRKL